MSAAATLQPRTVSLVAPSAGLTSQAPTGRLQLVLICVGIAAMPLLTPAGPGNTGPVDLFTLGAFIAVFWLALRRRERVRAHYAPAILLYFIAGAVAGLLSVAPGGCMVALLQDLFMLGWAVALAHVARTERGLGAVLNTWAYTAVAWSVALNAGVMLHISVLSGYTADEGTRAAITFGDPNRAGAYFFISYFILLATRRPRHWFLRVVCELMVLIAAIYTGSNAAVTGIVVGVGIVVVVSAIHRFGLRPALTCTAILVIACGYTSTKINPQQLQEQAVNGSQLVANTLGRSGKGGEDRGVLLAENLSLYKRGTIFGAGPGRTKASLAEEQAPYVKEAHNDYVATLVERGVGGMVGLLLLGWALIKRGRILVRRVARSAALPRPHVLVGAVVATAISGGFHEVLHWRHVWALLAVYAAAAAFVADKQRGMT
jgi:hypothetical protein